MMSDPNISVPVSSAYETVPAVLGGAWQEPINIDGSDLTSSNDDIDSASVASSVTLDLDFLDTPLSGYSDGLETYHYCYVNGVYITPGVVVEYHERRLLDEKRRDDKNNRLPFLKVNQILKNSLGGQIMLKGVLFRRCKSKRLEALLTKRLNEVCMVLQKDSEICIPASSVERVRNLRITNASYPEHSFRLDGSLSRIHQLEIAKEGVLVCRWVLEIRDKSPASKRTRAGLTGLSRIVRRARPGVIPKQKPRGPVNLDLRQPNKEECDRPTWHTSWACFRTFNRNGPKRKSAESHELLPPLNVSYNLSDSFCGAGGVSEGAKQAGLTPALAFDQNSKACQTYELNHPEAFLFNVSADEFYGLDLKVEGLYTEVLHASTPCQTFSPRKMGPGKHDDANEAAFFSVEYLIQKLQPRIFTYEQTFGIAQLSKHRDWYTTLLRMITSQGYQVRARVVDMSVYGLPSRRKRLIVLAACPGGTVPDMPQESHHLDSRTTIADALEPLVRAQQAGLRITRHHPQRERRIWRLRPRRNVARYSMRTQMKTIMASTCPHHPSGKRQCTERELALMQGFPLHYKFPEHLCKGDVVRQIGNAVPPIVAKAIFKEVIRSLRADDARYHGEYLQERENAIIISD